MYIEYWLVTVESQFYLHSPISQIASQEKLPQKTFNGGERTLRKSSRGGIPLQNGQTGNRRCFYRINQQKQSQYIQIKQIEVDYKITVSIYLSNVDHSFSGCSCFV